MVQLTRALMSSSYFCFAAKSAYYANDIHFVVDGQGTAPPRPGGGSNFFHTPWNTIAPPINYTRVQNWRILEMCNILKIKCLMYRRLLRINLRVPNSDVMFALR